MEPSFKSRLRQKMLLQIIQAIKESGQGMSRSMLMSKFDICETSAKDYTGVLHKGGILTRTKVKAEGSYPEFLYTVIASDGAIGDFLNSASMMRPRPVPPKQKSQEERLISDPSRHFHVAADDEPIKVRKQHVRIPPRDPLDVALFGEARAAA